MMAAKASVGFAVLILLLAGPVMASPSVNGLGPERYAGTDHGISPVRFAVSEPGALALVGAGLVGVGLARRRR